MVCWGLFEPGKGIGCGAPLGPCKRGFSLRVGHLIFRNARLWKRFSVQSSWGGGVGDLGRTSMMGSDRGRVFLGVYILTCDHGRSY